MPITNRELAAMLADAAAKDPDGIPLISAPYPGEPTARMRGPIDTVNVLLDGGPAKLMLNAKETEAY